MAWNTIGSIGRCDNTASYTGNRHQCVAAVLDSCDSHNEFPQTINRKTCFMLGAQQQFKHNMRKPKRFSLQRNQMYFSESFKMFFNRFAFWRFVCVFWGCTYGTVVPQLQRSSGNGLWNAVPFTCVPQCNSSCTCVYMATEWEISTESDTLSLQLQNLAGKPFQQQSHILVSDPLRPYEAGQSLPGGTGWGAGGKTPADWSALSSETQTSPDQL